MQFRVEQNNSRIFLPKLGWVRYRNSRKVQGTPRSVTVSLSAARWFISIQTEQEIDIPAHPTTSEAGIDVGIASFATLSDSQTIPPVNAQEKHRVKLARYQRQMARKVKFSNNWKKAKTKVVQKVQRKIADTRRDFLHKVPVWKSTSTVLFRF